MAKGESAVLFQYRRYLNGETQPVFIGDGAIDLFEIGRASLKGLHTPMDALLSCLHNSDEKNFRVAFNGAMDEEEPLDWVGRILLREHQVKWLQVHLEPRKESEFTLWSGFFRDITGDIATERENEGFRNAIDQSVIISMTGRDGAICRVNDNFSRISGYSEEELLGKNHRVVNSGHHSAEFFRDMWRTISKGNVWRGEICNKNKNGTLYWVDSTIVPILGDADEIIRYLSIRVDITARKEAEAVVDRQRASLISSAKLSNLGELAAGVGHEINNPLAIIMGKTERLLKALEKGHSNLDSMRDELEKVHLTAARIAKTVKGLQTFSRNATDDMFDDARVRDIVADTLALCQERFTYEGIELRLSDLPDAVIECRATQIAQVLFNLLNNSYDAIQDLPEKWIAMDVESPKPGWVHFCITDSGSGILPEIARKMMQPFFSTKPANRGTGLGLSISRGIAQEHGGSLEYDACHPNTRFVMKLPCKQNCGE